MKHIDIHLNVIEFPPIFRRGNHALILLRNDKGEFVLGNKDIYPKGISRMVGGGLDPDEKPAAGAARELAEETGVVVKPKDLKYLAEVRAHITDATDNLELFTTHLFFYDLGNQVITPQDDVKAVSALDEEKYFSLLHAYEQLPKTIDDKLGFAWYDYGQLYSFLHRLAVNELRLVGAIRGVLQK